MRWALRTLWACASGFRAYPPLVAATARQLWRYLLTIVLLSAIGLSVAVGTAFRRQMHELIVWAQQLPTITIVNGTAALSDPQPVRLERRDVAGVGDLVVVVDTTGQTTRLDEPVGFGFLLTAHELRIQQRRVTRTYSFRDVRQLTIDDAFLARWGRVLTRWLCGLLPFALVLYGLVARTLQALLWSALAWLMFRVMRQPFPFAAIWRLAVFALGPPLMFATIVEVLAAGQSHPVLWFLYLLVYAVMFNGALTAARVAQAAGDAHFDNRA